MKSHPCSDPAEVRGENASSHRWLMAPGPLGASFVAHIDGRVSGLALAECVNGIGFAAWMRQEVGVEAVPDPDPDPVWVARIGTALARGRTDVPVDLRSCSTFGQEVLEAVIAIPRGEVRTYGQVAAAIGRPKAYRAVGTALARNPIPLLVPCHRVVPAAGGVGQYGLGSHRKEALLHREGAAV